jgi:hypothetical protein
MPVSFRPILAAAIACASPALAEIRLGPLPPGEVARSSAGPADEIIGYLAFDPGPVADRLPAGMRFHTLAEKAGEWPHLARYLEAHPERRGWAWSFYEVIGVRAARYDRVGARFQGGRGGMTVWYAELVPTGPKDPRTRGYTEIALGSWVSDRHLAAYMRSRGFPAFDAGIRFERVADRVSAGMQAQGIRMEGGCRLEGRPFVPSWGKAPFTYETLWTPKGEGDTFEILSWGGHHSLKCVGPHWRVSGDHPFARAFNHPALGDPNILPVEFAYGYYWKSALYRRDVGARR